MSRYDYLKRETTDGLRVRLDRTHRLLVTTAVQYHAGVREQIAAIQAELARREQNGRQETGQGTGRRPE